MKLKNKNLPLDKFIDFALYDRHSGYYMKKNPFGKKGDFITAPNISRLFSEMLGIWIIKFWESLGCPKKFNLIELGPGNGEMSVVLIETLKKFPEFFKSCNLFLYEKSPTLIKIQKKKFKNNKIVWLSKINDLNKYPCIFLANEFFDSIPIKQFQKKGNFWFEKYVCIKKKENNFFEKKINIKKIEKKINFNFSKNQEFVEYSKLGLKYLNNILKILKKNDGGLLIIDYGYKSSKMKNTLQAVSNHKYSKVLENVGNSDITHSISFSLFEKFSKLRGNFRCILTNQSNFLLNMGIKKRAEMISKNLPFSKKVDIYYRLKRLLDKNQMGELFKVMLIKNKKNKFRIGF